MPRPSIVSQLNSIVAFSASVNPLRACTLASHSLRYPRKSSFNHYIINKINGLRTEIIILYTLNLLSSQLVYGERLGFLRLM